MGRRKSYISESHSYSILSFFYYPFYWQYTLLSNPTPCQNTHFPLCARSRCHLQRCWRLWPLVIWNASDSDLKIFTKYSWCPHKWRWFTVCKPANLIISDRQNWAKEWKLRFFDDPWEGLIYQEPLQIVLIWSTVKENFFLKWYLINFDMAWFDTLWMYILTTFVCISILLCNNTLFKPCIYCTLFQQIANK